MDDELYLSLVVFILFLLYGFSNIYIIVFLRRYEGSALGLFDFFALYLGNVKNYKKLNDRFMESVVRNNTHVRFNRTVSITHLVAPLLIPLSVVFFIVIT